jgi:sec-independent protein translocase protein TatA
VANHKNKEILKYISSNIILGEIMLSGWEWIIIIIGLVVLLLWGPSKIPELARGLGRAKAEFDKASRGEYLSETETPMVKVSRSDDDTIILIAKSLGLKTEGKSREEIIQEIIANIKALKSGSSN